MKFLEYTPLDSINLFLDHLNLGESTIKGNLEAFSCKHTGTDRKLSLSLEHEILDYLGQSSDSDPSSPVEYLSSRSSRRTLIYLVLTLSHMYPDYDFRCTGEEEWETFKQIYDTYLFEAARVCFNLTIGFIKWI
uniref:Repressor of RNA polymerase III transcription maf1 isoform X3 n=1 Tax=Elaeis guineensis var. tenera TaxID=51953 RepID=A0A6I9S5Y5_ELAGV|nr:repressor of RNA polymerase III transcription maf1 isoform X3 [Elaeis guineensis]